MNRRSYARWWKGDDLMRAELSGLETCVCTQPWFGAQEPDSRSFERDLARWEKWTHPPHARRGLASSRWRPQNT
jgi:hypothetical protein